MAIKKKKKSKKDKLTNKLNKEVNQKIQENIVLLNLNKSQGNRNQAYKNLENKMISQRGNKKSDLGDNIRLLSDLSRYNLGRKMGTTAPTPNQSLNAVLRQNMFGGIFGGSRSNTFGYTPELYNRMDNEQIQKQQEKSQPPK